MAVYRVRRSVSRRLLGWDRLGARSWDACVHSRPLEQAFTILLAELGDDAALALCRGFMRDMALHRGDWF